MVRSAATVLEIIGALTLLTGVVLAAAAFVRRMWRLGFASGYRDLRADLGRSILLGLELLVVADILNSVVIDPTLDDLAVLAGIVLIRTFLSVAIEVEINGHWPWQGAQLAHRQAIAAPDSGRSASPGQAPAA